jgi:hypothetical protein
MELAKHFIHRRITDDYHTPILAWRKSVSFRIAEQSCFTGGFGWAEGVKDRQHASHSLGDKPVTEDYTNEISTVITGRDANHSLGDPSKDGSTLGYRPPSTQDTDFCAAVLFYKKILWDGEDPRQPQLRN